MSEELRDLLLELFAGNAKAKKLIEAAYDRIRDHEWQEAMGDDL